MTTLIPSVDDLVGISKSAAKAEAQELMGLMRLSDLTASEMIAFLLILRQVRSRLVEKESAPVLALVTR